jgi:hypothetical protein
MIMRDATRLDEGNNRVEWKQVGYGKANGTVRTDKTINGTKKEDGMASYEVKTGVIQVRFMTASGNIFNIARSLKSS